VRPSAADPPGEDGEGTGDGGRILFVFPFDHDTVSAAAAVAEISAALNSMEPGTLLFLTSIRRLSVSGTGVTSSVIERTTRPRTVTSRHLMLSSGRGRPGEEWIVWHRPVPSLGRPAGRPGALTRPGAPTRPGPLARPCPRARGTGTGLRVEIAFRAGTVPGESRIAATTSSPLTVFFPTEKGDLPRLPGPGPYRTTPVRDNMPEHDPSNQAMARETAALLAGVLRELRADDLLTVEVLAALSLEAGHFPPGSMFRPLFDEVRDVLAHEEVVPRPTATITRTT
jgi:hypothetical protein